MPAFWNYNEGLLQDDLFLLNFRVLSARLSSILLLDVPVTNSQQAPDNSGRLLMTRCLFVRRDEEGWWCVYLQYRIATLSKYRHRPRLLQSSILVSEGLSIRFETLPLIGWHHPFLIGWSKHWLGMPRVAMDCGVIWPVWLPTGFQRQLTVSLHSPNGRQMPAVRAVQGDRERV